MSHNLITLIPYVVILGINFYLLPLWTKNTGAAMLLMLCVMPLIALVTAIIYGIRNGFCLTLSILAFFLFIPTVYLYYNVSAWPYAVVYSGLVLIGTAIGKLLQGKR